MVPVVLGFEPDRLGGDAHLRRRRAAFHARVDLPATPASEVDELRRAAARAGAAARRAPRCSSCSTPTTTAARRPGGAAAGAGRSATPGIEVVDDAAGRRRAVVPAAAVRRSVAGRGRALRRLGPPVRRRSRCSTAGSSTAPRRSWRRRSRPIPVAVAAVAARAGAAAGPPRAEAAAGCRRPWPARRGRARRPTTPSWPGCSPALRDVAGPRRRLGVADPRRPPRRTSALDRRWSGARPTTSSPPPAAVLGVRRLARRHGALAWCAVDRCRDGRPGLPLAGLRRRPARRARCRRRRGRRWRPRRSGSWTTLAAGPHRALGSDHGRRGRRTGVLPGRPHAAPREGAPLPRRVRPDAARGARSTPTTR